ncbi:hypothetical protein D3C78_1421440 [compost metagenome]
MPRRDRLASALVGNRQHRFHGGNGGIRCVAGSANVLDDNGSDKLAGLDTLGHEQSAHLIGFTS